MRTLVILLVVGSTAGLATSCTRAVSCGPGTTEKAGTCVTAESTETSGKPTNPKVTIEDCDAWGAKFAKLTKDAFRVNMKKCGRKATKDADKEAKESEKKIEKEANETFAKAIDEQTKELVKGCATQAGKKYVASDASCYMNADKMSDWGNCHFTTPFFTDFSDLGQSFDKTMQEKCDEGIEEAKGKKDDDD